MNKDHLESELLDYKVFQSEELQSSTEYTCTPATIPEKIKVLCAILNAEDTHADTVESANKKLIELIEKL